MNRARVIFSAASLSWLVFSVLVAGVWFGSGSL